MKIDDPEKPIEPEQPPESAAEAPLEVEADEGAGSEPVKPARTPLLVIEPRPQERARLEASADELERPLLALAPLGLAVSDITDLDSIAGIVVVWELGERTGLDWVEALAPLAAARRIPLAMASPVATRDRVALAVRAGASHFVSSPCDIDELRLLIGADGAEPPEDDSDTPAQTED